MTTPNPLDIAIGARLRHARQEAGETQERLGGAVGVTFQQIQKYENGTNRISVSGLLKAARFLKVDPSEIYDVESVEWQSPPQRPNDKSP